MSSKVYGIALAGAGMVSAAHADSISRLAEADLKIVYSRTAERAKALAERYNVPWSCDPDNVLEKTGVDIIDITTPPWTHADLGMSAAACGKHVIVEKPMDISLEKCDALIDACRIADVKLAVIFQNRFKKAMRRIRDYIADGGLGRILYGSVDVKWFRPQEYFDQDDWRGRLATEGGGVIINQAGHYIDLLLWMLGPVAEVYAATAITPVHTGIEIEDLAAVSLKFRSGALGSIQASTALYPGMPERLELHGTRGTIAVEGSQIKVWDVRDAGAEDLPGDVGEDVGTGASDPMAFPITWHMAQIGDMCRAIAEKREPLVNGSEGRKLVELCHYIYASAAGGVNVRLP